MATSNRSLRSRFAAAVAASAVIAGSLTALAPAASADVPTDGVVGIHAAGGVYAGTDASGLEDGAYVAYALKPGATGKYAVEVVNKGTSAAQYSVVLQNWQDGSSTPSLFFGSHDVTGPAMNGGYVTNVIAPGKAQVLSLRLPVPSDATTTDSYYAQLDVFGVTNGGYEGSVYALADVKATKGIDIDMFASSGSNSVIAGPVPLVVSSPTIKTGKSTKFKLVIKNDGTGTESGTLIDVPIHDCAAAGFSMTAKVGATDITSLLETTGYTTPMLAHGKSVTVNVTVTSTSHHPDVSFCANWQDYYFQLATAHGYNNVQLLTNAVH